METPGFISTSNLYQLAGSPAPRVVYNFPMNLFSIGLFGLVGVYSRYGAGLLAARLFPGSFPYGTFFVNIVGSLLVGLAYATSTQHLPGNLRLGVIVGFLGGFTTFSAYSLELTRFLEERQYAYAITYFLLSSVLGILAAALGLYLGRR